MLYVRMLQNSLESYLSCFAKYGSCVQRLLCFEEESICGSCDLSITDPNSLTCQTYQAFANAISNFIKSLRKELTKLEKKIIQQGSHFWSLFSHEILKLFNTELLNTSDPLELFKWNVFLTLVNCQIVLVLL